MTRTHHDWLRTGSRILLGFAGAMLALIMVLRVPWIASDVPLAYNEGWNAYHAVAVRDGTMLYPSLAETGTVNNYPPISFLLVGTIARVGGDPIRIGRMVNLLGLLLTVAAMVGVVRRLGGARTPEATLFTVVVSMLPFVGPWHHYLGINDPQMLAHGIMLGAAWLIVRAEGSPGATAGGAALMAVAGFTKHNLLPLPIAMLAWLWFSGQRRAAWAFMGGGLGAAAILVAGAYVAWGSAFFESLLATPRLTRLDRIPEMGIPLLRTQLPLLLLAAIAAIMVRVPPLTKWYFGLAVVICLAMLSGEGVGQSGVFDIGLAMGLVLALAANASHDKPSRHRVVQVAVLGWACVLGVQRLWGQLPAALDNAHGRAAAQHAMVVQLLQNSPGAVACEAAADCFRAGRPWTWDAFNVGQAVKMGHPAGARMIEAVTTQRFAVISMQNWPDVAPEFIPPSLRRALEAHYRLADSVGPRLLIPR